MVSMKPRPMFLPGPDKISNSIDSQIYQLNRCVILLEFQKIPKYILKGISTTETRSMMSLLHKPQWTIIPWEEPAFQTQILLILFELFQKLNWGTAGK